MPRKTYRPSRSLRSASASASASAGHPRQRTLPLRPRNWGGRRRGAGRKRIHLVPGLRGPGVAHLPRPEHTARHPVHVTMRVRSTLPRLRRGRVWPVVRDAIRAGRARFGMRVVHFSVQGNHLHLICEAADHCALTRGIQGLTIRIARALNRLLKRRGPAFADRYHARALRTPREVRLALCYVLNNHRRHVPAGAGIGAIPPGCLDPFSSAPWFDGWRGGRGVPSAAPRSPAVVAPRTWLLAIGWRRHGLLRTDEVPGPAPA